MAWPVGGAVYHHRGRGRGRGKGRGRGNKPEHFSGIELANMRDFMGDHGEDKNPRQGRYDPLLEESVSSNQQMMRMMR